MHSAPPALGSRTARPDDFTDTDAIQGVLAGDREMFAIIVRRYNSQLYRVGIAYLRDHAQTEDAMQNAYLKAFLHLHRFRGNAGFGTWLTRILINECLMILRARRRFSLETDENADEMADQTPAFPPSERLHHQEIKALLEEAIQTLPRNHRTVYLLREVQQLSTAETGECLGLSQANVKVLLHRAREGLKAELMRSAAGIELFDYPARFCAAMTARVMQLVSNAGRGGAGDIAPFESPAERCKGVFPRGNGAHPTEPKD